MPPKTYLFYDLETTGINKCFDQALQFAAIRTDTALKELERHDIRIKLNPDVIPSPEALLVHEIPIEDMLTGEPEMTAIKKIHTLLNTPGTISCGYNTLNFDDEFLRFSFHRNLLTPYTHQWANHCGRMDIYPITMLYFLYKNECINWPTHDGKVSLKLENLNKANQLAEGHAHTAIVDVEATVALARLFYEHQNMWNYVTAYFDKNQDMARMKELEIAIQHGRNIHQLGLFVGSAGPQDFYQFPALSLGQHNHYKNQTLWLRLDQPSLPQTTSENIADTTWVAKKRAGDLGFLLPYTGRFVKYLTEERLKLCEENLAWLTSHPAILDDITTYHKEYKYPDVPNVDVDASLYQNGFLSSAEENLTLRFHQASPAQKMQLVKQLSNHSLKTMAIRLMGRHYVNYMDDDAKKIFMDRLTSLYQSHDLQIPIDYRGEKQLTIPVALEKIHAFSQHPELNEQKKALLNGLKKYLETCVTQNHMATL